MEERLEAGGLRAGWQKKIVSEVQQLQIACGACIVLAGPNGAGKSTIVKTLARQIPPLAGHVALAGRNIDDWPTREFACKVAYVPQSIEIYRQLTVNEWVSLGRNPHQQWWSWQVSNRDKEAVEQALSLTNLSDLRNKYMDGLSGGERQRATIAMALAQEPQYLLLDEPSAHLDFRHQLDLVELLLSLRKTMGVLIVLHDLNLISRVATEVMLLKRDDDGVGRVVVSGPPQQTLLPQILRQVYQVDVSVLPDETNGLTSYLPVKVAQDSSR